MEEKKKKRIWPIILIVGAAVFLAGIILVLLLGTAGIYIFVTQSRKNFTNTYSYANHIANMNTTNMPTTVITTGGAPYDYTFVNDVLTKDETAVEAWINKYYPGSTIQKNNYQGTTSSHWIVNSPSAMNPVSIGGVIVNYDHLEFNLSEGYAEDIMFIMDPDIAVFNRMYNDLEAVYGQQQPYVGEKDVFTVLTDPSHEYVSYSWFDRDFDGYYSLRLTRATYQSQPENLIGISKH